MEYFYNIRLKVNRFRCWINGGCTIKHESTWNMPDDYHAMTYCKVCGAVDDFYGITSTDYEFILPENTPVGLFKMWREGRIDW